MDWLRRKPAMNPRQRNLDQSHNLVRPTYGMELKAGTSSLVSRGWISRERNPVAGGVFLLTSFLIERNQAFLASFRRLFADDRGFKRYRDVMPFSLTSFAGGVGYSRSAGCCHGEGWCFPGTKFRRSSCEQRMLLRRWCCNLSMRCHRS